MNIPRRISLSKYYIRTNIFSFSVVPSCQSLDCGIIQPRKFLSISHTNYISEYPDTGNFITKWLRSLRQKTEYSRSTLRVGGLNLYEKCVDEINLGEFIKVCKLPDTFFSWFLVTELHVWMCMARAMQEGHDGRTVRNAIVRLFWEDAAERAKLIGHIGRAKKNEQISSLDSQFHAALFIYDEGILSDKDIVLAGAIWRRLLQAQGEDPVALEQLVHYVRKQVKNLDECPREDFLLHGRFKWHPYN